MRATETVVDADTTIRAEEPASSTYIAGVGASAGGLDALETFFESVPPDLGVAYVVVQHLSPDFKSHMVELLERKTKLAVKHVVDGVTVEPDNLYLIPPNKEMVVSDGRLLLTERESGSAFTHPIDQFFRSLAHDAGRRAIGIVLSGTGSDGSSGVKEINEAGGLVLSQDSVSAQFDGMPRNAQATGAVHLVLPPDGMADALERYVKKSLSPRDLARQDFDIGGDGVERVFQLLRGVSGVDFSHYKTSTVGRRLQRRMDLASVASVDAYCRKLQTDGEELNELFQDMLIGVTQFFRDGEAFEFFEDNIIPQLISRAREHNSPLRIWVPGCASGEEAYSIGMLVDEALERTNTDLEWKIFATDIHQRSLRHAAAGIYSEDALSELSKERRLKYFKQEKDGFHIASGLRDHLLFAPQNVISDAPFTKVDLVSCRNLLIYLQPTAQRKVLSLFHFALRMNGILVLGPSETPGDLMEEFNTINSSWRVYSKRRDVRLSHDARVTGRRLMSLPRASGGGERVDSGPGADTQLMRSYDQLLNKHMPPAVLVDENLELIHTFAGAERFLRIKSGRATTNLLNMVDEQLRTPLAGAIKHALRDEKEVNYSGVKSGDDGEPSVRLSIRPLKDPMTNVTHIAIEFMPEDQKAGPVVVDVDVDLDEMARERVTALEAELRFTQENLQATIEELETSNEELQSTNEEMLAANEELQSTNEELQSVNEELFTVNTEHQRKIDELAESNSDMDNLLSSTGVGVIYLDDSLCIRRFTPRAADVFDLLPQDIGRRIGGFVHLLRNQDIEADCRAVMNTGNELERDFVAEDGISYLLRLAPYHSNPGGDAEGIVITLVDIDRLKSAERALQTYRHISEQALDGHVLFDEEQRIVYANGAYSEMSGYSVDELRGMTLDDLAAGDSDAVETPIDKASPFTTLHKRKDGSTWPVELSFSPVEVEERTQLFATVRDMTHREQYEQAIRLYNRAMNVALNGVTIAEARDNYPLIYVNTGFETLTGYTADEVIGESCALLQGEGTAPESVEAIRAALAESRPVRVTLRNYRKDGDPFWNDLSLTPIVDKQGEVTHYVGIQHDITEATNQRIQLGQRSAEVSSLLESTSDGIFGVDENGISTFVNSATVRMLRYDNADEILGKSMHELAHHTRSDGSAYPRAECPIVHGLARGAQTSVDDEVFWTKDGQPLAVEYTSDPIVIDGKVCGAVVSFRDSEERRARARLLVEAREHAEAANRAKSEFLASMSHEIRTPLTAIMGFVDVLQTQIVAPEQKSYLGTIKRNVHYLLDIINDILDLSKIEADRLHQEQHPVDLPKLIGELQSAFVMRAEEQGLTFEVIFDTPIPEIIVSNVTQVRQILLNLLANAMKFTERGRVDLVVRADDKSIDFHVRDTGIGIAEDAQAKIFEAFARGKDVPSRIGGTGLGLNISRRLAQRLNGRLEVKSELGRGSDFRLRLPLIDADPSTYVVPDIGKRETESSTEPAVTSVESVDGARILVVDDQPDILLFGTTVFREAGAIVIQASDGEEALETVESAEQPFDLILLDMQLPLVSGFDVARTLREQGNNVPILAVTAGAMKGQRERCLEAGCTDYLAKPVERAALLAAADRLLGSEKTEDAPRRVLLVEDHDDAAQALALCLRAAGYDVRVAASGAQARALFPGFAPDVCIIDQNLPDETGTELRQSLVRDATAVPPFYVVASGEIGRASEPAFLNAGFDAAFPKHIAINDLVAAIEKHFQ